MVEGLKACNLDLRQGRRQAFAFCRVKGLDDASAVSRRTPRPEQSEARYKIVDI